MCLQLTLKEKVASHTKTTMKCIYVYLLLCLCYSHPQCRHPNKCIYMYLYYVQKLRTQVMCRRTTCCPFHQRHLALGMRVNFVIRIRDQIAVTCRANETFV